MQLYLPEVRTVFLITLPFLSNRFCTSDLIGLQGEIILSFTRRNVLYKQQFSSLRVVQNQLGNYLGNFVLNNYLVTVKPDSAVTVASPPLFAPTYLSNSPDASSDDAYQLEVETNRTTRSSSSLPAVKYIYARHQPMFSKLRTELHRPVSPYYYFAFRLGWEDINHQDVRR